MSELVAAAAQDELLILPKAKVRLHGIDFDEDFLSELVARHFRRQQWQTKPLFSDAFVIYMRENPSAHRRKFKHVDAAGLSTVCGPAWRHAIAMPQANQNLRN
jgi:hypothetical protein